MPAAWTVTMLGMTKPGDGARLGQEAADDGGVRGELGMDDLDRDPAIERGVGREEDDPHPSPSQLALQPVLRLQRALEGREGIGRRVAHARNRSRGTGPGIYRAGVTVGCTSAEKRCAAAVFQDVSG